MGLGRIPEDLTSSGSTEGEDNERSTDALTDDADTVWLSVRLGSDFGSVPVLGWP